MTQATTEATDKYADLPVQFRKEDFNYHGGYLTHGQRFVARFKYNRSRKGKFLTFLCNNFTPKEYFERLDNDETPIGILESKGFDPLTKKQRAQLEAQLAII